MSSSTTHPELWLALRHVPRLGAVGIRRLFAEHQSIQSLWQALDLSEDLRGQYEGDGSNEYKAIKQAGIELLTLDDYRYPHNLKQIHDAAPVLYVMGQLQPQDVQSIGVVGTRLASAYGKDITQQLVKQLVIQEFTIVSGMARGIDAIAHRAAIESGGRTIAVWGSGLDKVYPPEHRELAKQILRQGAIISPYPLGVEAQQFTFPQRNKLIAGLSQGVVITEAKVNSGSMLTAEAAQKYKRPTFAVPGSIHQQGSAGPHQLIRQGAQLVVDVADIVESLGGSMKAARHTTAPTIETTVHEQAILSLLQ
jgi:DNA processing protein